MRVYYQSAILLVILVVPILALSNFGATWLIYSARKWIIWFLLAALAITGALRGPWLSDNPTSVGVFLLWELPLVQAALFVLMHFGFKQYAHRIPLSFDEARFGKTVDGRKHKADLIFWMLILAVLIAVPSVTSGIYWQLSLHQRSSIR